MNEPNGEFPWLKFLNKNPTSFCYGSHRISIPFVLLVFLTENNGGWGEARLDFLLLLGFRFL